MALNLIFGALAALSLSLVLWQWLVARRFPLHKREIDVSFSPALTIFKPLKGCDASTEECLRSWCSQSYAGPVQILFAVTSGDDPVCEIVGRLLQEFPKADAQLVVCGPLQGANAKIAKLAQVETLAKHDIYVISDADVRVPPDFLANAVAPLRDTKVGIVNCFYSLANPVTVAMRWEAMAINADFWSQVLQAQSLKPIDFAMGAVMATRRKQLEEIGGFGSLADCLADDYKLGNRIVRKGHQIVISPVVVECLSAPMDWRAVWKHQLRWARTIRVCQPMPYFFSILSNATIWPVIWMAVERTPSALVFGATCLAVRIVSALDLQWRLTRSRDLAGWWWVALVKDLLQCLIWLQAFAGNRIEWRGERLRLRRDGTLVKA